MKKFQMFIKLMYNDKYISLKTICSFVYQFFDEFSFFPNLHFFKINILCKFSYIK